MVVSHGMRRRRRRGSGMGRSAGGMGRSAAGGAATIAVAALVSDMRNPEGIVRPLLRGAADRLTMSRLRVLGRIGYGYLHLDRPRVQVLEPLTAGQHRGIPSLPSGPLDVRGEDGGTTSGVMERRHDEPAAEPTG